MVLRLRTPNSEDERLLFTWRNQDRVRLMMLHCELIPWDEHQRWFNSIDRSDYVLFEWRERPLGLGCITDRDTGSGTSSWGCYLGEDDAPPGFGALINLGTIAFAFEVIGVRKLCGQVLADNSNPLTMQRKIGFVEEGVLRQQLVRDGCCVDLILVGMLQEEWSQRRERAFELLPALYRVPLLSEIQRLMHERKTC